MNDARKSSPGPGEKHQPFQVSKNLQSLRFMKRSVEQKAKHIKEADESWAAPRMKVESTVFTPYTAERESRTDIAALKVSDTSDAMRELHMLERASGSS